MKSRAVVMRRNGGPEVLAIEEVDLPPLRRGEIRLRALASAVNHSDLQIRAGNWTIRRDPKFPYVPGLEVVGEVVEVADGVEGVRAGDRVWTMMQGLGGVRAERDGGYAEQVTVSASAVAPLPKTIDPIAFAAVGLAGVTAYQGLRTLGTLSGKTLIVTGPTGGVGSVAARLARVAGADVLELESGLAATEAEERGPCPGRHRRAALSRFRSPRFARGAATASSGRSAEATCASTPGASSRR